MRIANKLNKNKGFINGAFAAEQAELCQIPAKIVHFNHATDGAYFLQNPGMGRSFVFTPAISAVS